MSAHEVILAINDVEVVFDRAGKDIVAVQLRGSGGGFRGLGPSFKLQVIPRNEEEAKFYTEAARLGHLVVRLPEQEEPNANP